MLGSRVGNITGLIDCPLARIPAISYGVINDSLST